MTDPDGLTDAAHLMRKVKHVPGREAAGTRSVVEDAISGDPEAVRAVWASHRRWVAAILLAHKPRHAELDDLLQDVAMAFVRTIRDLRDPSALKPWLRTVAINAARLAARRAPREHIDALASQPAISSQPNHEVCEEGSRLLQLARRLPDGYREPLMLRCVNGMSYRTISELLGLPETTIETRIARGRRMLREEAEREDNAIGRRQAESPPGDVSVPFHIPTRGG